MRSYVAPWGGALAMALLLQMPAHADDAIELRYQRDVTACHAGQSGQSLQDCLREAGAVRQTAQSGNSQGQALSEDYQRNAMQRCARLPAREQFECEALKNHPDSVMGSVQGGGTMRALTIREVGEPQPIEPPPAVPTPPVTPQAVPAPMPAPAR